jgi:hypothetical protein
MQTVVQEFTRENLTVGENNIEATERSGCSQVREKLDALFDGDARLEETHAAIKKVLFAHLEICEACCRMFDVRTRYGSRRGRPGIL